MAEKIKRRRVGNPVPANIDAVTAYNNYIILETEMEIFL